MKAYLLGGALSGIAGLLAFLVIHHFWIMPIWFITPFGLLLAGLGGLAVGWAYAELHPHLPPHPWTYIALVGLISVILLPAIVLAEIREPMFDVSIPGGLLMMSVGRAALIFILELPLTATLVGGMAGWFIGRTRRVVLATALAGFIFALGPGHNIPFLGSTPGTLKGIVILLVVVLVSTVVLVETEAHLFYTRSNDSQHP